MPQYQPHEAQLLHRVYETLLGEPWFNRNAITERELLKLILENHAGHRGGEAEFVELCRSEAMVRFSIAR